MKNHLAHSDHLESLKGRIAVLHDELSIQQKYKMESVRTDF